jgi:ParB/Sulfiredoxin domain
MKENKKSWRDVLPVHPAAELFPLMSPDELKALSEDIKKNGLQHSVAMWRDDKGKLWLLDGRNRLDALELIGINLVKAGKFAPDLVPDKYVHNLEPYSYATSANIHRRHLTSEQKRELIAKLLKATPEKSNNSIGKLTKTDDKTVAKVRRKLESTSEIPKLEKTVGQDGKARKWREPEVLAAPMSASIDPEPEASAEARKKAYAEDESPPKKEANDFIREVLTFTQDYVARTVEWHDSANLSDEDRTALVRSLYQCADKIMHLAQAIDRR